MAKIKQVKFYNVDSIERNKGSELYLTAKIETRGKSLQETILLKVGHTEKDGITGYLLYTDTSGTISCFQILNFTSKIPAKVILHVLYKLYMSFTYSTVLRKVMENLPMAQNSSGADFDH